MPEMLTPREVADLLRTTPHCLAVSRCCRRPTPPYLRIGRRILYRRADVEAWLATRVIDPAREVRR